MHDTYYEEQSRKAIQAAIEWAEGKPLEEVRAAIHRAYPFGPLRSGRAYKVWNRMVLAKEAELDLEPRKHQKRQPNPVEDECRRVANEVVHKYWGGPPAEIRYQLGRAYPFGNDRKGAKYKTWCRVIGEVADHYERSCGSG